MMRRVRFARAADGTSIAYSTLGDGPPLVLMPAILFSHLETLWELPQLRRGLEQLAKHWTIVRYDDRGCGLSERSVTDFSLDAHLSDLEAVVDSLGLDRFALNAPMIAGPVGIAFAARHPDRVTHLVLQSTIGPRLRPLGDTHAGAPRTGGAGLGPVYGDRRTLRVPVGGRGAGEASRTYPPRVRDA